MSLTSVRPYFRTHCNALGFTEWMDGFNIENIPSTLIDMAYHIGPPQTTGISNNQGDQVTEAAVEN
jgi:hypothetical protein